jgi:hypothetical protein
VSYSAPNRLLMPARHSIDTLADSWSCGINSAFNTAGAWPSANLAIYVPVRVPSPVIVRKLWYASGSTSTGNVDMGLFDGSGVALVSATNAAKVSTDEQVFDVTDTWIGPGTYWIGLASDSATDTFIRSSSAAPFAASAGIYTQSSAYPLPSTATYTVDQTLALIPVVGMLVEATVA